MISYEGVGDEDVGWNKVIKLLKLGGVQLKGCLQVKKLFKGLKCHYGVNKDYEDILEDPM